MNSDIATACAWTQADRRTQQTNIALNEFDAEMHQALVDNPMKTREGVLIIRRLIKARSSKRLRQQYLAIARVAAKLSRIEGEL